MDSWERLSLAEGVASAKVLQQKLLFMLRTGKSACCFITDNKKRKIDLYMFNPGVLRVSPYILEKKKGVLDVETTARNPNGCYLGWGEEAELG